MRITTCTTAIRATACVSPVIAFALPVTTATGRRQLVIISSSIRPMHIISSSHLTLSRRGRRRSPRARSPRWRRRRRPPLQQQLQLLVPWCRRRRRRYWSDTCRVVRRCTFCLALLCWSARCGSRSRSPLDEEVVESPTLVRRTAAAAAAAPCGTGIHHGKANANRRLRPSQKNDLASKPAKLNSKRTRRTFCRCSVPKKKKTKSRRDEADEGDNRTTAVVYQRQASLVRLPARSLIAPAILRC